MFPETNPAPGFVQHPEHTVTTKQFEGCVTVSVEGTQVARSTDVLLVEETNHAPAYYLPFEAVNSDYLADSSHVTRCPFKGKARYWNIHIGNHEIDNAMWSYEMPYDEALELAGLVAFYPNKVQIVADPE